MDEEDQRCHEVELEVAGKVPSPAIALGKKRSYYDSFPSGTGLLSVCGVACEGKLSSGVRQLP